MSSKKGLWITAQKGRKSKLKQRRNLLVKELAREGLSYGDIGWIVRVDKASAYRIVKSKPVTAS